MNLPRAMRLSRLTLRHMRQSKGRRNGTPYLARMRENKADKELGESFGRPRPAKRLTFLLDLEGRLKVGRQISPGAVALA